MNRETIRDIKGHILGYIDHEAGGRLIARDPSGNLLGFYDKASDTTRDSAGNLLYQGNIVTLLLH